MTGDRLVAGGQDVVVVGHDVVRRQAAVLLGQRHRSAGGMEAHAEIRGGVDLGGEEVAGAAGVDVQVVRRRRATRQGELGEPDPRRQVRPLGVEARPQRIQRLQPAEERLGGHRRKGAGEVLVQVVMGVDEPGGDQTVRRVEALVAGRWRSVTERSDQPAVHGDPSVVELAPLVVHRGDEAGAGDDEVVTHARVATMAARSSTVVSGLTMHQRSTVSPCHAEGVTKASPRRNCSSLQAL